MKHWFRGGEVTKSSCLIGDYDRYPNSYNRGGFQRGKCSMAADLVGSRRVKEKIRSLERKKRGKTPLTRQTTTAMGTIVEL